jgi:serine/threonine protein kinase
MEPGQLIDQRYEIIRLLGSGAMASVYEVRHTSLHSRHAIKILSAELARSADLRNRFLSEGRIQAQLRHPNIVAVSDIVTDPAPGLVMELIEGGALDDYLAEHGPITDPEAVLALILPILEAVGVAHEAGIVHRDLKPENILMGTDARGRPRPAVADFGIARVLESTRIEGNKRRTEAGVLMGTILYMSPEQVRGADVDARSDVFALGAILYEILTGQIAFDAPSKYIIMKRIVEGDLPSRAVGDLHQGFGACIRTALAVDPDEWFPSCLAFHDALISAVRDGGPLPVRPSQSRAVTVIPDTPPPLPESMLAPTPAEDRWALSASPTPVPFEPSLPRMVVRADPLAMPWVTALVNISMLLTGVGQMMNGQAIKGLVIFFVHWSLALLTCFTSMPVTAALASLDSWLVGQKLREGEDVGSWEWF